MAVVAVEIADGQIRSVSSIVNPEKLAHLGQVAAYTALLRGSER
jgi:hypothetical protein